MTNTDRLIATLEHANRNGTNCIDFYVGRYTGNGASVVGALRRRGYRVEYLQPGQYRLHAKSAEPDLAQAFDIAYEDQCRDACGL